MRGLASASGRRLGAHAVVAVTGVVALAAVALPHPAPARAALSTQLSGSNGGGSATVTDAFGQWRGSSDTIVNSFLPWATWNDIANPGYGGPDNWKGTSLQTTWAVPMLPQSGGSIATGATGAYNKYFVSLAKKFVADGQGNTIIRLGWEMNGTWMNWNGVNNPTAWIAYWRQVVTAMRAVPGAHFLFDWSPGGYTGINTDALYPGDAYVDEVGMSVYDQTWDNRGSANDAARWSEIYNGLDGKYGLKWLASFADTHNKPMGFGEWGLSQQCDGTGGGDDPYFIQQMRNYFSDNNVAWEAYFDIDMSSCQLFSMTAGHFPKAAALYKVLWDTSQLTPPAPSGLPSLAVPSLPIPSIGIPTMLPSIPMPSVSPIPMPSATVPVPSVTVPSGEIPSAPGISVPTSIPAIPTSIPTVPASTGLWLNPAPGDGVGVTVPLNGAITSGKVEVVANVPGQVASVLFVVDGKNANLELTAPYDLETDTSQSWNLDAGQHTISALVTDLDGTVHALTASFTTA